VKLAEALGAPVIDQFHTHMNFPQDHPLHAGFDAAPYFDDADCIVAVESDVLWFPALKAPRPETKIVQIAVDPLFARYPIRGFPADAALSGTVSLNLTALAEAVRQRADVRAVGERTQRWHAEHQRLREAWAAAARKVQNERPLEMLWVSKCVGDLVDEHAFQFFHRQACCLDFPDHGESHIAGCTDPIWFVTDFFGVKGMHGNLIASPQYVTALDIAVILSAHRK